MVRPLLDRDVTRNILTASMSTVHATTNSQTVLDTVPKTGAIDLRKTRSVFNNIILTSTGAAKALELVMPEIGRIGFMADSVRVPLTTGSLIILNVTFQTEVTLDGRPSIDKHVINHIYREAAEGEARGLVVYSEEQNVSADMVGMDAAVVIEAVETHTRTGFIHLQLPSDLGSVADTYQERGTLASPVLTSVAQPRPSDMAAAMGLEGVEQLGGTTGLPCKTPQAQQTEEELRMTGVRDQDRGAGDGLEPRSGYGADSGSDLDLHARGPLPGSEQAAFPELREVRVPVTHLKVFGWYDNELGSYTGRLAELTAHIAQSL
jgi:hypothetical protein